MKLLYSFNAKISLLIICLALLGSVSISFAAITFVSPTASSSFAQCGSIVCTTNTSQYVVSGIIEVYKGGILVLSPQSLPPRGLCGSSV
jgi:hypothetical protein